MTKRISKLTMAALLLLIFCMPILGCSQINTYDTLTSYKIDATLNDQDKTVTASQTVKYVNTSPVEIGEALFHLYPAAYREGAKVPPVSERETASAYPDGMSYGNITVTEVAVGGAGKDVIVTGDDQNILSVPLGSGLLPGESVTIDMKFTVTLPHMRHRLGYYGGTVNLGNWFPIACAYYGDGFVTDPYYSSGDPFCLESSNFDVTITAPKTYTAVMSGKSVRTEGDGTAATSCKINAARDFAVVLGTFEHKTAQAGDITVNYYYYADNQPDLSLKAAVDSIKFFGEKFGAYPYDTYNAVQTAFNQGGMEYTALTYISDAESGELYREVIIHETAHQWWFSSVGNNQITEAWMDEALAEYSTTLFYENSADYNVSYNDRLSDVMSAYTVYCDVNDPADTSMNRKLCDFSSSFEYTYMVYVKGQLMMDALRRSIGDKAFYNGLRSYAVSYANKIATPDDMIGALEKAAGCDLKGFFDSWLNGKIKLYGGQLTA